MKVLASVSLVQLIVQLVAGRKAIRDRIPYDVTFGHGQQAGSAVVVPNGSCAYLALFTEGPVGFDVWLKGWPVEARTRVRKTIETAQVKTDRRSVVLKAYA